ncbi:MAG TPA: cation diffusion facilitator family transporter, partial [Candidatus Omnitrophota bacterium]|nr:cation diffusion facilitator family transporter [Candidatus Omnitrophota bacterium]
LLLVCFHLLHDSVERFKAKGTPNINISSFVIMGVTMIINICVMLYEYSKGKKIGSDILVADSLHTRADILTSFSVIGAFIGVKLGYPVIDSIVAVFIAIFIGFSAFEIFRRSSQILCDTAVIDEREVEKIVLELGQGVKKCHRIRSRGRIDDIYIDLHVLVDDRTPVITAHNLSSKIEHAIKHHFDGVSDVIVHIEPLSSEKDDHDGENEE